MSDIGLMFKDQLVRAIKRSDDPKSQTRRIDGLEFINSDPGKWRLATLDEWYGTKGGNKLSHPRSHVLDPVFCRIHDGFMYRPSIRYATGRKIWVRETYRFLGVYASWNADDIRTRFVNIDSGWFIRDGHVAYRADEGESGVDTWRPSILMPRFASRFILTITDVRFQRIQDISGDDCFAEGIDSENDENYLMAEHFQVGGSPIQGGSPERFAFICLWDLINGGSKYSWQSNPWVSAITFKTEMLQHGR